MNQAIYFSAAAAAVALALGAGTAQAADVGVSISVSQPGVYGRIDIGQFPQPAVVVNQPVWVQRAPVYAGPAPQPVYLWVPPGQQKHWNKFCGRYNACGVPVYFVREDWYQRNVVYGQRQGEMRGDGHDDDRHHDRHDGREMRREDRAQGDHGRGHERDQGKGHGRDNRDNNRSDHHD